MLKARKAITIGLMVIVWLTVFVMLFQAPSHRGKLSIGFTGLAINSVLAFYYSVLNRRPASYREWFTRS